MTTVKVVEYVSAPPTTSTSTTLRGAGVLGYVTNVPSGGSLGYMFLLLLLLLLVPLLLFLLTRSGGVVVESGVAKSMVDKGVKDYGKFYVSSSVMAAVPKLSEYGDFKTVDLSEGDMQKARSIVGSDVSDSELEAVAVALKKKANKIVMERVLPAPLLEKLKPITNEKFEGKHYFIG